MEKILLSTTLFFVSFNALASHSEIDRETNFFNDRYIIHEVKDLGYLSKETIAYEFSLEALTQRLNLFRLCGKCKSVEYNFDF